MPPKKKKSTVELRELLQKTREELARSQETIKQLRKSLANAPQEMPSEEISRRPHPVDVDHRS
jgi:hypothetical protein